MHFSRFVAATIFVVAVIRSCQVSGQCVVNSTTGYSVSLSVHPEAIVTGGTTCPNGYSYNVRMAYDITFSGENIPSSMYTLQGVIDCGGTASSFDLPNSGGSGTVLAANAYRGAADCATATPALLGCNTVSILIHGIGVSDRTIECQFPVLPVELVHFEAIPDPRSVELTWTTASELNSDHFVVERSVDGGTFEEAVRHAAAGTSAQLVHYSASDHAPMKGLSYYRLRQVDLDGTWAVSRTEAVVFDGDGPVHLYPNPVRDDRFSVDPDAIGDRLEILSTTGHLEFATTVRTATIQLPSLPAGIHFARFLPTDNGTVRTLHFVKE
ncbi:MAG: T9SS type A sorting domain-containing protein [Flavobacteriales bacterium]